MRISGQELVRVDRTRVLAILLIGFAAAYGFAIDDIVLDLWAEEEALNSRTLPMILCGGLIVLALTLLVKGSGKRVQPIAWRSLARLGAMLAFMMLFALVLELAGFWIAGAAFLASGLLLMGERRASRLVVVPTITIGIAWLLLRVVLDVYLPAGELWMG